MHWLGTAQECQVSVPGHALRRLIPVQGCTGSTSITCVHSAVARNSLTYLTALETPGRNGHQSQGTAEDSQASPQRGGQRQQEAGTEQGLDTKGSRSTGSCARLSLGFPGGVCDCRPRPFIQRRF